MMDKQLKVWVVDYGRKFFVLQWKDPITGKRRSKSSGCVKKRDAERAAAVLEGELRSLIPRGDGSISWANFTELYEFDHLDSLSDASRLRSLGVLSVFQKLADPLLIANVTGAVLSDYAKQLRDDGRSEATIATHIRTLRAALEWARANNHISALPKMPQQARARRTRAKGRPLTQVEFVAMLRAVSKVVGRKMAKSYRRLLIGLWLSGLRLEESLELTWGEESGHESAIWIDTSRRYPLLGIMEESQKSKRDQLLPLTPDFGRWLLKVPKERRRGFVFPIVKHRYHDVRLMRSVSKVITQIGKASGVTVNSDGKFASAHDLRRSFGLRWSSKVMPAELQALMRHASVATTMQYYAIQEATSFAERLWSADSAEHNKQHNTQRPPESNKKENP